MTDQLYESKEAFLKELSQNYSDIKVINSGGGGIIYSAYHRRLGKKVILKKIRASSVDLVGKERELIVLTSLSHTYLPKIYDFWSFGDEVYTVMELIEGSSLKELIDAGEKFSEAEVIRMTRQLAEVVTYLHNSELHLIHSDIKPANIMLTCKNKDKPRERDICLIDFNISVLQESGFDETIGYTNGYAPVEQLIRYYEGRLSEKKRSEGQTAKKITKDEKLSIPDATMLGDDVAPTHDATTLGDPSSEATSLGGEMTTLKASKDNERTVLGDSEATILEPEGFGGEGTMLSSMPEEKTMLGAVAEEKTVLGDETETRAVASKKAQSKPAPKKAPIRPVTAGDARDMAKKYGRKVKLGEYTDIYSICATMYSVLTGKAPQPCTSELTPIEKLCPDINDAFAHILTKGLKQDPKKRYQTSEAFKNALGQIAVSTKAFKRMRRTQDMLILLLTVGIGIGAFMTWRGGLMKLDDHASEAISLGYEYYNSGKYDEAIELIGDKLFELPIDPADARMADAYYLIGCCYLESGELGRAVENYRLSLIYDSTRTSAIRDYGIALARCGMLDDASETLDQAKARGASNDDLLLLEGEIAYALGSHDEAEKSLSECISSSEDQSLLVRAALRLDTLYGELDRGYDERLESLDSTAKRLSERSIGYVQLCERQAQLCMEAADSDESYIFKAIELFESIAATDFSTLTEQLDLAICYQRVGEYDKATERLTKAAELYPNYLVYKRLAFLEIDRQASKAAELRDYASFGEYYETAMKLYKEAASEEDMEMEFLERTYAEVVKKGWTT